MNQPLLSIVIANYNYGRFLPDALDSIISQNMGEDVEIIIIDGGSTDNSVEVIQRYANGLPPGSPTPAPTSTSSTLLHMRRSEAEGRLRSNGEAALKGPRQPTPTPPPTSSTLLHGQPTPSTSSTLLHGQNSPISYWISEPDSGQSNAFNKGFAHANGRFLTWLNADDVLMPGTIAKLKNAAARHPDCEWFVGGCFWLDKELRVLKCFRARSFSETRFRTGQVSSWGPSSFFTKRILDLVGGVDERCKYTMDGDLWLKFAAIAKVRYLPFADYAWGLRLHECAKMSAHNFAESGENDPNHPKWKQIRYEGEIRKEYFTPTAKRTRWNWFRTIRWGVVLLSRLDTLRFRGKSYKEYFK